MGLPPRLPRDYFNVEKNFSDISSEDHDALIGPGGCVGADKMRANEEAVNFIRGFFKVGKPAGVICRAPRTLTSYWSFQAEIRNAGGGWVDEKVVTDQGLVTSRYPGDFEAFCGRILEGFEEGKLEGQKRGA